MNDKPRVLVIERDATAGSTAFRQSLAERFEVVVTRSLGQALAQLHTESFEGVCIDAEQLSSIRWAGITLQADEILNAIADGVVLVDPDLRILWTNPEFLEWADPQIDPIGSDYYRALGSPEVIGDEPSPFITAVATRQPATTTLRVGANRYLRLTVTPVFGPESRPSHLIALSRDVTAEIHQEQKLDAIHRAGEELADLKPDELSEMTVSDRTNLLKYNIVRHMRDLLGLDYIEIRLLDRESNQLVPLLTEGMTPLAADRELYATRTGNGVTGFVAATGQSYLCPDTASDPLYLEGAAGARSSLTVPLTSHGAVIGTLNVESAAVNAFDDRDRQFLEIYSRSIGSALHTLELLHAEQRHIASASVEAISREIALPLDDILSDVTTVLDRYQGDDAAIKLRLRNLLDQARGIRAQVQRVGSTIAPPATSRKDRPPPRLAGLRILVVDGEETTRSSAHVLLGPEGALVETAQTGERALALARISEYDLALADIRLADMDGYTIYRRLREVQPELPVVLMTGFGYDPTHSIVKARQEGLSTVLYKPFRAERLFDAVKQVVRCKPSEPESPTAPHRPGSTSETDHPSAAPDSSRPHRRSLRGGGDAWLDDSRETRQG